MNKVEFLKADPIKEKKELTAMDARVSNSADRWTASLWKLYTVYWVLLDGEKIGCIAFGLDMVFNPESETDEDWQKIDSVYWATTSILEKYRTPSLSELIWQWKIAWADEHGFSSISTNCRVSDSWYRQLCESSGFAEIGQVPYFEEADNGDPEEDTFIFELSLS